MDIESLLESSGVDLFGTPAPPVTTLLHEGATGNGVTLTRSQCASMLIMIESTADDPFTSGTVLSPEEIQELGIDGDEARGGKAGDPFDDTEPEDPDGGGSDVVEPDSGADLPEGDQAVPEQSIPASVLQAQRDLEGDSVLPAANALQRGRERARPRYGSNRPKPEPKPKAAQEESVEVIAARIVGGGGGGTVLTEDAGQAGQDDDVDVALIAEGLKAARRRVKSSLDGRRENPLFDADPDAAAARICGIPGIS